MIGNVRLIRGARIHQWGEIRDASRVRLASIGWDFEWVCASAGAHAARNACLT